MSAYPSAEVIPSMDEANRPAIGPNLAGIKTLCEAVTRHIYRDFFYPYLLQQQRLWDPWDRIDDAWRVKGKRSDLDISETDPAARKTNPDGRGDGVVSDDGISAKVYPAALHKQIRNKTDMHMSIAYADGLPVRAKMPKTMYEHSLYNPTAQTVAAANELISQCADSVQLKMRDRKVRGSWSKYGHAWVHVDFQMRYREEEVAFNLPLDPLQAMSAVQQIAFGQFGGQRPQMRRGPMGENQAVWIRRTVDGDSLVTDFVPIRHDAVFIDQTLSADDMDRQPCPIIRSHVTRFDLWGKDYDPQNNPFGWLNTQLAQAESGNHFTLSAQDEESFTREIRKKYGLSDAGVQRPRNTLKQLWTCYPMLAIDPATGELDEGEGIICATCQGHKQIDAPMMTGQPAQYSTLGGDVMPTVIIGAGIEPAPAVVQARQTCPACQGQGRRFIQPQRYVVQMYGMLSGGGAGGSSATCLRIQRNPTVGDKVPLLFGAHLTEDTAGAIPLAVTEASLSSADQLATSHNQVLDAKNQGINRQWLVQTDEPAAKKDNNRANRNVLWDSVPPAPAPTIAYDITANLTGQMIPMLESEVQEIIGIPPVLMGMVSSGRRAATEIQTSSDAAKLPITVEIDSCNTQIHGRWAQFHLDNIEAFGDRDWILRKTGRTSFGRVMLHTEVANDFFTQQAKMSLLQNFLPMAGGIPGFNVARAAQEIFEMAGFENSAELIDDGGARKAQMDGFELIASILLDGKLLPPRQWDPHEIYIQMFQQALDDKRMTDRAPQNVALLQQRLMMQQALYQQQQQAQFMMQLQQATLMNAAQAGPQGSGRGANARKPSQIPENATAARQQQAGRDAPQ